MLRGWLGWVKSWYRPKAGKKGIGDNDDGHGDDENGDNEEDDG